MQVKLLGVKGSWREVADACRTTVGKEAGEGEPSSAWKRRLLLSEHSPIRKLVINWKWVNLLWWVQTHFTRHHIGVEWFVQTSRTDRTGVDRNKIGQDAPVDVEGEGNVQALINISRKRLCFGQPSPETRQAWNWFLQLVRTVEPEVYSVCVPECVYRGFCPEMNPCGYSKTESYREALARYRG